jgi:DNA invertase Pin-like site-specific DNA recombinase
VGLFPDNRENRLKKAALYARVSTSDQSYDMQLADLRRYAAEHFAGVREYLDTGISGKPAGLSDGVRPLRKRGIFAHR